MHQRRRRRSARQRDGTGSSTSADYPGVWRVAFTTQAGLADVIVSRFNAGGRADLLDRTGAAATSTSARRWSSTASAPRSSPGTTASTNFPMVAPIQAALGGGLDAFLAHHPRRRRRGAVDLLRRHAQRARARGWRSTPQRSARARRARPCRRTCRWCWRRSARPAATATRSSSSSTPPYTAVVAYATYLGGSNNDEGMGAAIDAVGRVFVAGAASYPFPVVQGASDTFVYGLSTATGRRRQRRRRPAATTGRRSTAPIPRRTTRPPIPTATMLTNAQELATNTHPLGFYTRYLAEGATGSFFDDRIALFNPTASMARRARCAISVRRRAPSSSSSCRWSRNLRMTVNPEIFAGLEATSFATVGRERPAGRRRSDDDVGRHRASAAMPRRRASRRRTQWYLAEGATGGSFDLYYLLQNPSAAAGRRSRSPICVPHGRAPGHQALHGRRRAAACTINVDNECFVALVNNRCPTGGRWLSNTDVSAKITLADAPILVERAMYMTSQGRTFNAGHDAAGRHGAAPRAGSSPKARPARSSTCSSCSRTRTSDGDHGRDHLPADRAARRSCAATACRRTAAARSTSTPSRGSPTSPRRRSFARSTRPCRSSSSGRCGGRTATGSRRTTAPARP